MKNKHSAQLTQGEINPILINMTRHMIWGLLAIISFNIIDVFFVGLLGDEQLAAISFTFPVVYSFTSIAWGLSVGMSSIISKAIGEGDHHRIQELTTHSLIFTFILVFLLSVVGYWSIIPVFSLLGASGQLLVYIEEYMEVWYLGVAFLVIPLAGNSAIRATGDSKTPSQIMILAGFINVILDPLLIFGIGPFPELKIAGAAWATLISYVVSFIVAFGVLKYKKDMLDFSNLHLLSMLASWKKLLHIGFPAAATNLLMPVSNGILLRLLADHGTSAVAAFGIGIRLESLACLGMMALSSVITPFVGQNLGAGYWDRIRHAMTFSFRFSLIWGMVACFILFIGAEYIAAIFSDQQDTQQTTALLLKIIPVSYGFYGLMLLVNAGFNGLQQPLYSVILISLRLFAFTVPLALLGNYVWGISGIFYSICISNVLIGIIAWAWMKHRANISTCE
jgi:putative MATE family efflux protein